MNILTLQPLLMKSRRFHIFPVRFSDGFGVRSTGGIAKKRWDDNDDDDHVKMRGWNTHYYLRQEHESRLRERVVKSLQFSPMFLLFSLFDRDKNGENCVQPWAFIKKVSYRQIPIFQASALGRRPVEWIHWKFYKILFAAMSWSSNAIKAFVGWSHTRPKIV